MVYPNLPPAPPSLEVRQPFFHAQLPELPPADLDGEGANGEGANGEGSDRSSSSDSDVDVAPAEEAPAGEAVEVPAAPSPSPPSSGENSSDAPPAPEPSSDPIPGDPAPLPPQLNIIADYQDYDAVRQVVTARGSVQVTLSGSILQAEKVWINLANRYLLAEGDVVLTRGQQLLRGQRAEYSLVQQAGTVFEAKGQLLLTAIQDDFADPVRELPTSRSVFDPLNPDQGVEAVASRGGLQFGTGDEVRFPGAEGGIRQLRFEAARVNFDALGWEAEEVRITNDPFSPPELELRSDRVTLTAISAEQDLLVTRNPRLVFDQGFALPLVRSRYILNRGQLDSDQLNPFPTGIGLDDERGGLYLERSVSLYRTPSTFITVTPQYLVGNAFSEGFISPDTFGVEVDAGARLGPRTTLTASADLSSFDLSNISENLRASARAQRLIGTHTLALEYSYRDRLYNGSLGFQDVRSSLGAVLLSPVIPLNNRGLQLTYQVGAQYITAATDRADLLGTAPADDLISLGRLQGSARLSQGFTLWRGAALPPTATEGLRYTPTPVVPQITLSAGLLGVTTYYTSGEFKGLLAGDVRFDFQFGHFSKPAFDYTRFNIGYYQALVGGEDSPFLFDRNVDQRVFSFGLTQQVYGPFLLGFQSSINLDSGEPVSTDYFIEYSRRTYGILIRYSPTRQIGAIGFRLSDFSWIGGSDPFDGPGRDVEGGVIQR